MYDSLKKQTFRDFEWVIVDDGSEDKTVEHVRRWQAEADFPIRYYWQENRGKHFARNRGVVEAHGSFFFTWDSDDICVPMCLELMKLHWDGIPDEDKPKFAGVTGLCARPDGALVGSRFPRDVFDSDMHSIRQKHGVLGEKCGFQRTDVMKEFPFPEFEGEKFIPESVVWYRISRVYRTRFVNEILRIFEPNPTGLTSAGNSLIVESPCGRVLACSEAMRMTASFRSKLKLAVNYSRFSLHARKRARQIAGRYPLTWMVILGFPLGLALYLKDRWHYRK